jgi:ABC-type nitrate/sulfonate/bicarbonate transport system substrate-binding protein
MMLEGVPISIAATWAPLTILSVITGDPAIKSLADLKGKSMAGDMGSSEYQITSIYSRKLGLVMGNDVTVVQAAPAVARAQLQAQRVDAAMLWEPTTTLRLGLDFFLGQMRAPTRGATARCRPSSLPRASASACCP